ITVPTGRASDLRLERQLPRGERHRPLAVLDACEALFLGGGDHAAVAHDAGGAVVIRGVDAEGVHARLRINAPARRAARAPRRSEVESFLRLDASARTCSSRQPRGMAEKCNCRATHVSTRAPGLSRDRKST